MCTPEYDLRFADEQPLTSACEAETVGPIVYKLQATYAPFCALRYPPFPIGAVPVSYTHLTLPTKRIV